MPIDNRAKTFLQIAAITMCWSIQPAMAGPHDYDGTWSSNYSTCGMAASMEVTGGKIMGRFAAGSGNMSGSISGNGNASIQVQGKLGKSHGSGSFSGVVKDLTLVVSGSFYWEGERTRRSCAITFTLDEPHPDSLAAQYLKLNPRPLLDTSINRRPVDPPPVYVGIGGPIARPDTGSTAAKTPRITSCEIQTPVITQFAKEKVQAAALAKPKLYALSIGVSRYRDPSINLTFASKDACDMARWIATQEGGLYRQAVVRVLYDDSATKDAVLEGLEWIVRETTAKDVAMIFIAGHGVNDATGEYFFLPHDANVDSLSRTAVPQSDIRRALLQVSGKALMFVDTCHSGQIMAQRRSIPPDINRFIDALVTADNGAVAFSASTGRQFAIEDEAWGNGAFTTALLEGLSGKADYNRDKSITMVELDLWLSERVKELTGGRQATTTAKPSSVQDFPIAVLR